MFGLLTAGLSSTFTDPFTRADSPIVAAVGFEWTEYGPWEIAGNVLRRAAGGAGSLDRVYRSTPVATGFAECVPLSEGVGPMVASRSHEAVQQESCWTAQVIGGETRLYHIFYGGFPVNLDSVIEATHNQAPDLATDTLAIEVVSDGGSGAVYRVYINGSLVIEESNTAALYTGVRGIIAFTGAGQVEADNYAEGV